MNEYKTKEQKLKFYKSKEWKALRREVLKRDNYECQECKRNGSVYTDEHDPEKHKRLDVDHLKEIENYPELALDIDNCEVKCVRCHNKKHNRFQKRRKKIFWDDEKW
ncbi:MULTISPECIES: HNH endonuclease [Bacteria]|jgi:5-methylcytosine-specific restriction enzyme A|uniref:HNH endonuclease n=1 Tax=Bacteria TaxID=2 RepID=UPI0005C23051|nr:MULTISPECIES: HNH endonuclease [Bacteria]KIV34460.1 alpha/beta hydrolase [Vibrio parahaemolyticus]MED3865397.1 HNH endonuclease [Priestia megaterium]MED4219202.1 HNH endonuclease [Priestia megaterium]